MVGSSAPLDLLFVAAEMAPYSKTGGLADVAEALPRALAARGHRVWAVAPNYAFAAGVEDQPERIRVHLFGADHEVGLATAVQDGVRVILVDHPTYRRSGIYGDAHGPYGDNLFRYALLSRVALELGRWMSPRVVVHANDWHTALLPVFLRGVHHPRGELRGARVVLGLHNLGHQGSTDPAAFAGLGLAPSFFGVCEMDGRLNPLKAGIVTAEALVAVSPSYARQICDDHGFGLEPVLRARESRLFGILNGIDDRWDPARDPHLAAPFSADDLSGKARCKQALQHELGLPQRADVPLLGLISRLDAQKGIDLVQEVVPWLLQQDVQLVMLGSGAPEFERFFRDVERAFPDRARGWVGFNEALAHRIEAGADVFLMPSRFEPCGLNQMYSMRYGTVPVVHRTGGLADTVVTVDPAHERGNGWAFSPFGAEPFVRALTYALGTWRDYPGAWRQIQQRGMTTDFSWDRSAAAYEQVYREIAATA